MADQSSFSDRHGYLRKDIVFRDDLSDELRQPVIDILRRSIPTAFLWERIERLFNPYGLDPLPERAGPIPVSEEENRADFIAVKRVLLGCEWFRLYDLIEDIFQQLKFHDEELAAVDDDPQAYPFQRAIDEYFAHAGIGWQLVDGQMVTVSRLMQDSPVPEMDALMAVSDERDFEAVAKAVREAIERNEPEGGLDRLHTFVIKYVRSLCTEHGVTVTREKPLHSLFGELVKRLRDAGHVESEMTSRILKSSISILEAFNDVRNNQSLAHDNPMLNYEEALLIFNHVASSIRFLRSVNHGVRTPELPAAEVTDDDIPN